MRRRTEDRKKWTSLDTFRLIAEFESMPFLWNVFDEEYKNKRLKSKAIERLACYFDTSPWEITRKLHNLRCQYTSEIRKIRSRSNQAADRQQSHWSYFDSLKFLSPVVNVRSLNATGSDIAGMAYYDPGRSDNPTAAYGAGDGYSEEEEHEEASSGQEEMKFNPLELDLLRKRSFPPSDYSEKRSLAEEIIKLDDFDIFGKLVATHLRKMPLDRAIRCQEKLFTLIMQERLAENDSSDLVKAEDEDGASPPP